MSEIERLERELKKAEKAAERAMRARAALPPGSSRARVTSANARWAAAAEHRDRLRERLEQMKKGGVKMTREEIYQAINDERERQDRLHPGWYSELALGVLMEEVGEVAEVWVALQQEGMKVRSSLTRKIELKSAMRDEIIQVAAVCVRWLEEDF